MKKLTAFSVWMSILFGLLLLPSVYAAEITLNSRCGLADAILAANSDRAQGGCRAGNGADTIILSRDITLDGGLPKITSEITIEGEGYTISGDNRYGIFFNDGGTLTIHDLVMIKGSAENEGGLITNSDGTLKASTANPIGGAIVNWGGTLVISNSSFSDNSVNVAGGAIYNLGELSIRGSSFSNNSATDGGGGAIANGGELSIRGSSFSDNSADFGGAILNNGELSIRGSSFSDNSADSGGAIADGEDGELSIINSSFRSNLADKYGGAIFGGGGELSIINSSFSGNSADGGGGAISNYGELSISNSTFSDNEADVAGAIFNVGEQLSIINSIIAGDGRNACYSVDRLKRNINNFIEDGSCSPAFRGDPGLGALVVPADGSPAYYPLLTGSPAIDAADDVYCSGTDQIGTARPQGAACDIGAYEYVAP